MTRLLPPLPLRSWDTRSSAAAFQLQGIHRAGVVSVACCPHEEYVVATGSYDERVRLWDVRKLEAPTIATNVATGGGCWRLAWHPTESGRLLCSCMGGGFALVRGSEARRAVRRLPPSTRRSQQSLRHQSRPQVVLTYCAGAAEGEHGSLAYGADWLQLGPAAAAAGVGGLAAASVSFYDRSLHVWCVDG